MTNQCKLEINTHVSLICVCSRTYALSPLALAGNGGPLYDEPIIRRGTKPLTIVFANTKLVDISSEQI